MDKLSLTETYDGLLLSLEKEGCYHYPTAWVKPEGITLNENIQFRASI